MEIREIEVSKISPNRRTVYTTECIEAMVRSIRICGQLDPVLLCLEGDSLRILDGEKRWRACKKLGIRTIRAIILEIAAA